MVARIIEGVLVVLIAVVAIVGNTSLWIVILNKKYRLRSTNNVLFLCLSGTKNMFKCILVNSLIPWGLPYTCTCTLSLAYLVHIHVCNYDLEKQFRIFHRSIF